ncbi:CDP-glucose 4,6-dehydratase [Oceanibacterium hippocampi]|uniref:CDP-glucose 4,6-dehydratase n=1 Tax=Oceanibacterium hippocampi TaxID=745714 RepID=A0A1Y5TLG8_9PROT|nr:CDP-glucose 4,6-dehydratase [Oceanibacterium hippocampi]SLN63172.1 CDP-glucose 4,6-dehydratase [Oceanibacterium hippocampi]
MHGHAPDPGFWRGRRVFLTGHTGFKGAWLTVLLHRLGAVVTGYSLAPVPAPSLYELAGTGALLAGEHIADIRDADRLASALVASRADTVLHLAAQALVRESYRDPLETFSTNVMGTANLLEAVRRAGEQVRAVVVVTTDKCYENAETGRAYRESDPLGGHDPYSASKACAEIVTQSMRRSFFGPAGAACGIASARAGNVIGGGDFATDRLVPDFVRARVADRVMAIRNPAAVRPWQHVLEPLNGYLLLAERLAGPVVADFAEAWNFGPDLEACVPVERLVSLAESDWPGKPVVRVARDGEPHEATLLMLDTGKAQARLDWRPRWSLEETIAETLAWYRAWHEGGDPLAACREQIDAYLGDGKKG